MSDRLAGRTALVTGVASGIGAACAARLGSEGARVAGLDVTPPPEGGPKLAAFHEADVRDEARVAEAVAAVKEGLGRIDVLVNAAGVAGGGPVHLLDTEEWDRVVDINLKGTFLICKHVLAAMVAQEGGSVVNVASIEGLQALEAMSAYNASKGGVVLLTKQMAIDYGRHGIRVNCLCPGFIRTPMTEALSSPELGAFGEAIREAHMLGRMGEPAEVAAAAAFLASDDASFVTGHALVVDGGFTAGHRFGFVDALLNAAVPGGETEDA
jgi:NAD(P)-dependent dehydrogenase (short-subunit alcohol dehydrogenase family)